ncbi:methionine synthase [Nakamurella flavida]|uniref:Methionine synthase n=1 Tax=Nakamurella flavida TaxID=363630 RepID=A0A939C2X5_9ACTN|nr:methionine synthase [Nakamurella flavida]MBM9477045.1 methionine synthase [Nakamurella flavida]MDP9779991.1 hypothetical protein [Nakamurella flavida]
MTLDSTSAITVPDPAQEGAPVVPAAPWHLGAATGVGSLPGVDADESARVVAGELPVPHLVELPARGPGADMVGRAVGVLVDLYGEVVPSGWRLSRRPGRDVRRAKDYLAWDLDAAEQHYAGASTVKIQLCGPWTLAAAIEVPSGNRALIDQGAVDDLAASLAEGLRVHVAELTRRLPGTRIVVQLDEPSLPAVLLGALPTASGFGTVRAVERVRVAEVLQGVFDHLPGVATVLHCCHEQPPIPVMRASGAQALSIDLRALGSAAARLDPVGEAVEGGTVLLAGIVPASADELRAAATDPQRAGHVPGAPADTALRAVARPLLELWNRLGFPRDLLASTVVPTPVCGLVGATEEWAARAMTLSREMVPVLQEAPQGW